MISNLKYGIVKVINIDRVKQNCIPLLIKEMIQKNLIV